MTIEDAIRRLREIQDAADDDEHAHGLEDGFRADVLRAVADGSPDGAALARVALQTSAIKFARWYA